MRQRLRLGTHASVAATGLATVLALSVPAYADGDANAKARGPGVASLSAVRKDVTVDYSALDSLSRSVSGSNRALLIPQTSTRAFDDDAPIVLQPPPGVAPTLIPPASMKGTRQPNTTATIKLRPPAGVKPAAPVRTAGVGPKDDVPAPARKTDAPKAEARKAEAPKPAPKVEIAKAEPPKAAAPAPKATAPASKAAAPAPAAPPAPKAAAPIPPPAPPVAKTEVQPPPAPAAKPAIITPPPPAPTPAPGAPAAGAPRSLLPEAKPEPKPETKVAVIPPAEAPKAPEAPTNATPEAVKPAEPQTAALPPAKAVPDTLTIGFDVGVPDVPGSADADLKSLAARMKADAALRVQLLAFASDPEKSVSRSRRLSLERAVNVRKQLLAAGIDSTRIEVRALGEQSGDGAPDRVDAITSRR
jgi:outer membrane protein OmpA-like peptidoglycan-associated protein